MLTSIKSVKMESGKVVVTIFALALITVFHAIGNASAKPMDQQWSNNPPSLTLPQYELHPIDVCIFACDHCLKGEALVLCANECILSEGNGMSPEWIKICPYLAKQYTHNMADFLVNPYRH